jgi:hypothetical protein
MHETGIKMLNAIKRKFYVSYESFVLTEETCFHNKKHLKMENRCQSVFII